MDSLFWHTEIRELRELIPSPSNPRQMKEDQARQLIDSLSKFNYVELVAIQPDNRIIAGHMRVQALRDLGRVYEQIEVRVPNRMLTDEEMREYMIRSNKNTGEWDYEILANEFEPIDLVNWGFDPEELGFNIEDVDIQQNTPKNEEKCITCGRKLGKNNGKARSPPQSK